MTRVLTVDGLRVAFFTYYGVVRAVNGASFFIDRDETLGIVGESGSGKSVTAAAIMGLIDSPGAILGGRAVFEGVELFELPEAQWQSIRGHKITMCFQNPMRALNPVLTVGEQIIRVYHRHMGVSKKRAWAESVEMLREVNIPDAERVMRRYPHQLSGGMCQRVMIVMALMCSPSLLILDEPTTGLDVTVQKQLLHLLKTLRDKAGASQWMITHDLGVAANLCDRVVVMYAGRVMEEATVEVLFARAAHPYTSALLTSIPQVHRKDELTPIPGSVPESLNLPSGCPFHPRCERAMPICEEDTPEPLEYAPGHRVACHLYGRGGEETP